MSITKLNENAYFVIDESSFASSIILYDPIVANQGLTDSQHHILGEDDNSIGETPEHDADRVDPTLT